MKSSCCALLLLALALATANAAPADGPIDCAKVDDILNDAAFGQGITTSEKIPLWASNEEWASRCAATTDSIKLLKRVNKECFSSLTQQVFATILRSRQSMLDTACKPDSKEFKDTVELGKCVKANALAEAQAAERKGLASTTAIANGQFKSDAERTQRSCCSVVNGRKDLIKAMGAKCGQFEPIMNQHADSYMSEAVGLICADVDKLNCDKLEPLKLDGVEVKGASFIVPMLKAIKHMDH